jgi:hypothetical protein
VLGGHQRDSRTVDDVIVVALGAWLVRFAGSCTDQESARNVDTRINGKFVITDAARIVEEALVFAGAAVPMCHTMAATIDACTKEWVFFIFEATVATGLADNSNGPINIAGGTGPIHDVMGSQQIKQYWVSGP